MKKLLLSLAATAAISTQAGDFKVQSFLNPAITALIVSNTPCVATNLAYIAQNQIQGVYQVGTNAALGTTLIAPIATNQTQLMFSNAVSFGIGGQTFPGSLIILTNGASQSGTGIIEQLNATNNFWASLNPFQDVVLGSDLNMSQPPYQLSSNSTNVVGIITAIVIPNHYPYVGLAGFYSNIVNIQFTPIPFKAASQGGIGASLGPQGSTVLAQGPLADWEITPTTTTTNDTVITMQFTNHWNATMSLQAYPHVATLPVTSAMMAGYRALRCRSAGCSGVAGVTTNQVAIVGLYFSDFVP